MRRPLSFYQQWRNKAVSVLLLIALLPLLLAVIVRAVSEAAQAVVELLGPVIPYVVAFLVLAGTYRLVLGRRRM